MSHYFVEQSDIDTCWYSVNKSLDKEFIYFSYFENGVTDAGAVRGRYRGSKIIKITKFYNKIDITVSNTSYYFHW